ncbi:MAG TPA: ATP-binding cassette domain-containing protein, partial [Kosmotoga arenicorallina]|nr:ATP-binding cassette domain-containing protein [Kosmotoga arenicorallina]
MSYLQMENIIKRFPGVLANDNVSVDFDAGEIHAIVGENGAGKSTLMKILYGEYQPDSGRILMNGKELVLRSPRDAIKAGIGMVHQKFMLVPSMKVYENIILGDEIAKRGVLNKKQSIETVRKISERYGLQVDVNKSISEISVGSQQRVEILKLLYRKANVLIFDEPTSVLTPSEVES